MVAGLPGSALLLATAYLFGGLPLVPVLVRWRTGQDVRAHGTGNPGTSNVYRSFGARLALLTGPAQFAQGLAPVLLAHGAGAAPWLVAAVAVAATAGSAWPVWLRSEGGGAVGVATGAIAGLGPVPLILTLCLYLAGLALRRIALGVLAALCALPLLALAQGDPPMAVAFAGMLVVVIARRMRGLGAERHPGGEDGGSAGAVRRDLVQRLLNDRRPAPRPSGPP